MSENQKRKFGITQETKASNNSPLLVATRVENNQRFPSNWKFPITRLVNVVFNGKYETKNGDTSVIQFIFIDKDNRQYIHTEWEIDENDSKFDVKYEGLNVRIKHIYMSVFGTFPAAGIGGEAESFSQYLELIAKAFNSKVQKVNEKDVKSYTIPQLYTKVVIFNGRIGFPLSPNFLERVQDKKPCTTLSINLKYDKLEAESEGAVSGGIPGLGDAPAGDDLPSFDGGYS